MSDKKNEQLYIEETVAQKPKKRKISGKVIFNSSVIIISLIVLSMFVLADNGIVELTENLKTMNVAWLIAAIVCNFGNIFIEARLTHILVKENIPNYTFFRALKCSMVGQFFSAITPFSTGGQPMQIYLMSQQGVSAAIGIAALTQKFLVYQTTLVTYSIFSILVIFNSTIGGLNGVMLSFAFFGFISQSFVILMLLLFSFNKKLTHVILFGGAKLLAKIPFLKNIKLNVDELEEQLEMFHSSNKELIKKPKLLIRTYALTALQLTAIFIVPYCVYRSFNLSGANPINMIASQAFVTMTTCFIPLPGAAGASEISFMGFFANYFTEETLKSAVLIWRVISYYLVILVTAPFSQLTKHSRMAEEDIQNQGVHSKEKES